VTRPDPSRRPYLGYRDEDRTTPFARYFTDEMAPLAPHVVEALNIGAQPAALFDSLDALDRLHEGGYRPVENGYAVSPMRVAVLTQMPRVTAAMWDWWFGWHGSDTRRYKLWHPRAHLYAEWADGPEEGLSGYLGRTSYVDEYIGPAYTKAAIRFVAPSSLGLDEGALAAAAETAVCARVGPSQFPAEIGYLAHHVRPTGDGVEMRSRFWMGGRHVAVRTGAGPLDRVGGAVARRAFPFAAPDAAALLVHCAQEMAHLASFLPELHAEFGHEP
jgi:hypothetical protein